MLLSYKWMDGIGLGSLCGAIIRASLRDANKCIKCHKSPASSCAAIVSAHCRTQFTMQR